MIITYPETRTTINAIRGAIGRPVDFYIPVSVVCSACTLNPYTNTSTNPFCTTCNGEYYITSFSGTTISAHVTWGKEGQVNWVSAGQFLDGDCRLQIEYTNPNITVVANTAYIIVDGKKVTINKKMYRGVPSINRMLLDCIEEDE